MMVCSGTVSLMYGYECRCFGSIQNINTKILSNTKSKLTHHFMIFMFQDMAVVWEFPKQIRIAWEFGDHTDRFLGPDPNGILPAKFIVINTDILLATLSLFRTAENLELYEMQVH